jgi:hypothetical protein
MEYKNLEEGLSLAEFYSLIAKDLVIDYVGELGLMPSGIFLKMNKLEDTGLSFEPRSRMNYEVFVRGISLGNYESEIILDKNLQFHSFLKHRRLN